MNAVTTQTTDNALEQFYLKLLKSPELQAQLKSASDPESLCQMAVNLGADMGYKFTIEQARAAMAIEVAIGGDVLEESNLSTLDSPVAFGSRNCSTLPTCNK